MSCLVTQDGIGFWWVGCLRLAIVKYLIIMVTGFARSFGLRLPSGERREWVKPIMFSGGIGSMEDVHRTKEAPEPGKAPPRCSRYIVYAVVSVVDVKLSMFLPLRDARGEDRGSRL